MKPIFLIGYMGTGKSTLGRALAERCKGISFIDLDDYIEAHAGMKIRDIFALKGEPEFRRMERQALEDMLNREDAIIACGGGTPCFPGNMELMNSCGTTVFLTTSHERLFERLKHGRAKRPLIANLSDGELSDFISTQLAQRMPHYAKASETFDSTTLECENEIEAKCQAFISRFLSSPNPKP